MKHPKQGDKTECNNWCGITLSPTIYKVCNIVLLHRVKPRKTTRLIDNWERNRQGLDKKNQIFVLRNIIEQSIEIQSSLYLEFVAFEKAFDSLHREWKLSRLHGLPKMIIDIVRYQWSAVVTCDNGQTEWFPVTSGLKQSCTQSPLVFNGYRLGHLRIHQRSG